MAKRAQLAHARKAAGYTQESFAEALGVDRSTVARWEAGDHEPLPYLRPKMARLLAISRDELTEVLRPEPSLYMADVALAVGSDQPDNHVPHGGVLLPLVIDGRLGLLPLDAYALLTGQCRSAHPDHGDDGHDRSPADETLRDEGQLDSMLRAVVDLSGEDLKRRDFLLGAASTTAAFADPALFALTAPPVTDVVRDTGSRRIGMVDVEILTDNVTYLRRMDFRYGSGRIRERAVRLLHHEATSLLHGSYSDSTGRALLTAVAQAARLAASMTADVGRHALAQRYYIQGLSLAMNAGNRLFAATMLSDMSRLTIQNATGQRCADRAVALVRAAKTVAGEATPTLAAQLSAVEARALALRRDTSAARTTVLDAERNYERFRPDGEPAWLSFYTEAELAADLGRALRDSAEPVHATRLLHRTLDSYEPWRVRSRCFVQTDLAVTYLINDDHELAATLTRDALTTAAQVSSGRTISRIQAIQQQIRPLHSVGLAELDDEITDFLRAHDDEDMAT